MTTLRRTRLTGAAFRALERYRAYATRGSVRPSDAGLPLPPPLLMVQVAGHADADLFLAGGRDAARTIRDAVGRHGPDLSQLDAVLDFGVGCGRVARHWADLDGPRVVGTDYNPRLADWTGGNLPFVEARTNRLEPPITGLDDATFDCIYAISVLTHLTEPVQRRWAAELHRLLRPGGVLVVTTAGDRFRPVLARFDEGLLGAYDAGELVVTDTDVEGGNRCNAYHPPGWIARELGPIGFDVAEFTPEGMASSGGQDLYVLRRRTAPADGAA